MRKLTIIEFIERSKKVHGNKYDYSQTTYCHTRKKLRIICPIHGAFYQYPKHHFLQKSGCPSCGLKSRREKRLNTLHEFISSANKIHKFKYDYSEVDYQGIHPKITIICKRHGKFQQSPNSHLADHGCPKCNLSKGERKIEEFLQTHNIQYKHQWKFDDCRNITTGWPLKFDFFIPSKLLLIEFDGQQHSILGGYFNGHQLTMRELKHQQRCDRIKDKFAKRNGITLLRISYTKMKSINKILKTNLDMS